jgi:pyridoxamine 5'-phosphate oxidase
LREEDVDRDPIVQFRKWFDEARHTEEGLPEAMALATSGAAGEPSARMVLLKGFDERGFVFYTNTGSRKGKDLAENPRAALVFYWSKAGRQVRITGEVEALPREDVLAYFNSRPVESRLSALASRQSRPVPSRQVLESAVAGLRDRYAESNVPLPDDWGGYRVRPATIEFWLHRDNRLHDRLRYTRATEKSAWSIERLAP